MNFKKIDYYLNSKLTIFGFLMNLGVAILCYFLVYLIKYLQDLAQIWQLNLFAIFYLISYLFIERKLNKQDTRLKLGFVLGMIAIGILIIKLYIEIFLKVS